jgi:hypothetical protein
MDFAQVPPLALIRLRLPLVLSPQDLQLLLHRGITLMGGIDVIAGLFDLASRTSPSRRKVINRAAVTHTRVLRRPWPPQPFDPFIHLELRCLS